MKKKLSKVFLLALVFPMVLIVESCSDLYAISPTSSVPREFTVYPTSTVKIDATGTSQRNDAEDWLSGGVCSPPCWENITPGVSNEDEVAKLLDLMVIKKKASQYYRFGEGFKVELQVGKNRYIGFRNNKVDHISFDDTIDNEMKLEDVIKRIGEPDFYAKKTEIKRSNNPCEAYVWDDHIYKMDPSTFGSLIYPSKGITLEVAIPGAYADAICPEMRVDAIFYVPLSIEDALKVERHPAFGFSIVKKEDLIPWHGYGPGY